MPDPNWIWLVIVLAWGAAEFWGIRSESKTHGMKPFTYWTRDLFHLHGTLRTKVHSIGWYLAGGILLWICFHFLVEKA